jgi:hypothetical protein
VLIQQLSQRVKSGGLVVLGSSYTWDTSITDTQHWIGGFKRNGENLSSEAHLFEIMSVEFDLLHETQVISQFEWDERTSQTANNHITIWRKRV